MWLNGCNMYEYIIMKTDVKRHSRTDFFLLRLIIYLGAMLSPVLNIDHIFTYKIK